MPVGNRRRVIIVMIFLLISIIILLALSKDCPNDYLVQYFSLSGCHVFLIVCLIAEINKKEFYIFEPIIFIWFLYWMIFAFTPIYNILTDNMGVFGVNTMGGCVKATIIFIIGYIAMALGYRYRFRVRIDSRCDFTCEIGESFLRKDKPHAVEYDKNSLLKYSYLIWVVIVGLYLFYNMLIGRNPLYMLTFGLLGSGLKESKGYSVDFLGMLVYASFVPMLNILANEKSKFIRSVVFAITCIPIATRGFRSALVVPLTAPFIYYYLKNKRSPKIKTVLLTVLVFILLFGLIGSTRVSLRSGGGINLKNYTYMDGSKGVMDYFGSYKVFYGAVMNYPSKYNYTYGGQLIYTIIMYIPRLIWRSKPSPLIYETIANSINSTASKSGSAWPNIGEYYTDGGIVEVVLVMLIIGILLRRMKRLYENPRGSSLCAYSALLPGLVMIIAYGYTAGNLPGIIFIALPYWGERYFVRRK